ncbi:hypothetical protein DPSP01_005343 [Paraphaeosphaeria sporulosa]|uniref:Uncharacterized protein n=1 Tax=Paraphaeosphaeria sporulosa TaxID=1460663 RepID=A0A177C6C5_9PLEO|nr:uncharacterized protein CC84DRAFT_1220753 [Paraphaeosphaeria sporulosa]OAG02429.1 hypothetical protein CC84DRAFT_1220753 [Paraphaeosphaeria sporulosa]
MADLKISKVDTIQYFRSESSPAPKSTQPRHGTNYFFGLPREIRDMIYEYTLTEPGGLFWCQPPGPFEATVGFTTTR